jgi:aryl-alcohol dehydrogenase-like predicted oxidoreductase
MVLVHSDGNDVYNIEHFGILEFLNEMKSQGHIRAFGMSTKTVEGGILAAKNSDVVMITYNPIEVSEKPVIQYANENKKGILIKKALASGHLDKMPGDNAVDKVSYALQFIFQEPGVSSVIIGTLKHDHLLQAIQGLDSRRS